LNLINNENLHEGRYLERSMKLTEAISPLVDLVRTTLARRAKPPGISVPMRIAYLHPASPPVSS